MSTKRGVTPRASELLRLLVAELGQPYLPEAKPEPGPRITCPADVYNLLAVLFGVAVQEELWVLCLDTRNRVIAQTMVYRGSVNTMNVRLAEVLRPAITANAPAIVLVHNHPSGDPTPSEPDIAMTRQAYDAGTLLGIDVLDHLIVGQGTFYSLKEHSLGFPTERRAA